MAGGGTEGSDSAGPRPRRRAAARGPFFVALGSLHPYAGSGCSRGRSTPPALPAPKLGRSWGLRCRCPGVWPGPAQPRDGPWLGARRRGPSRRHSRPTQDCRPRGRREKSRCGAGRRGAPRTGSSGQVAGPGVGGRLAPGPARRPGGGGAGQTRRSPGSPVPWTRETLLARNEWLGNRAVMRTPLPIAASPPE